MLKLLYASQACMVPFLGDGIMEIINFEICFCYELLVAVMRYSNHGINCVTSYKEHKFLFMVSASWERQSFFFLFFFSLEAILILLKFPVIHCIDIVEKLFIIQHLNFLPNPLKSWGMKISPIKLYAIIKKIVGHITASTWRQFKLVLIS